MINWWFSYSRAMQLYSSRFRAEILAYITRDCACTYIETLVYWIPTTKEHERIPIFRLCVFNYHIHRCVEKKQRAMRYYILKNRYSSLSSEIGFRELAFRIKYQKQHFPDCKRKCYFIRIACNTFCYFLNYCRVHYEKLCRFTIGTLKIDKLSQ